jgi:hypothetical protein
MTSSGHVMLMKAKVQLSIHHCAKRGRPSRAAARGLPQNSPSCPVSQIRWRKR